MKKYIANIITGIRVAFSLPLLLLPLSSVWFYTFYLFCGLSDMIDGTIARKTGAVSKFGARLDTVADLVFMFVCAIKILPTVRISVWLWVWILLIALGKIGCVVFVLLQSKALLSIHSIFNKATGVALFLLPFTLPLIAPTYSALVACVLASVAAAQEGYYVAKGLAVL